MSYKKYKYSQIYIAKNCDNLTKRFNARQVFEQFESNARNMYEPFDYNLQNLIDSIEEQNEDYKNIYEEYNISQDDILIAVKFDKENLIKEYYEIDLEELKEEEKLELLNNKEYAETSKNPTQLEIVIDDIDRYIYDGMNYGKWKIEEEIEEEIER